MLRMRALSLLLLSAAAISSHAQTYSATSLHPSGAVTSDAFFVGNGRVTGRVDNVAASAATGSPLAQLIGGDVAWGTDGTMIVGTSSTLAVYWANSGSVAAPLIDLGFGAAAYATEANAIVGSANDPFMTRALHWASPTSAPTTLAGDWGSANAISGSTIVGSTIPGGLIQEATLWDSANAFAATSLHNGSWDGSYATGVAGDLISGVYIEGGVYKAATWSGPTRAHASLHDAAYDQSMARGVAGTTVVGSAWIAGQERASVWNGGVRTDLHGALPANYSNSWAYSVDAAGNIVGGALNSTTGQNEAFLWQPAGYVFGPFLCPINDPATPPSAFQKGDGVLVRITLEDTNGNNAPNVPMEIKVEKLTGPNQGVVPSWRYQFNWYQTNSFYYIANYEEYWYPLNTQNLQKAYYRITATVDGASHSVIIRVV